MSGSPGGGSGLGTAGINAGSTAGRSGNGGVGGGHLGGGSSVVGNASGGGSAAGSIVTPAGYKLVWHDEFDVDGPPNPSDYNFEKGFQRNEEAQWYQSANATVQAGLLVIEARKETVQNPNYTGSGDWKTTRKTAEYTSSSLSTSGHQSFQYGHFEMRARIPTEAGMWPAWWTLGVSGEWPSNGEIDIMEFYQSKLLANVACGTDTRWQAKWDSSAKPLSSLGADWAAQFHVWTMDWDPQSIVLSVDNQQLNTSALSSMLNSDGKSPFNQKAYMIVNLAIGGQNGGDPSKTSFPKRYEIDYLRVFQKQ
jgi:beta-glucanase (GH16 family)